jgi:hypothetical protein
VSDILVERLRAVRQRFVPWSSHDRQGITVLCEQAADEIVRLRVENKGLRGSELEVLRHQIETLRADLASAQSAAIGAIIQKTAAEETIVVDLRNAAWYIADEVSRDEAERRDLMDKAADEIVKLRVENDNKQVVIDAMKPHMPFAGADPWES